MEILENYLKKALDEGPAIEARKKEMMVLRKKYKVEGKMALKKMKDDIKVVELLIKRIDVAGSDGELHDLSYEIERYAGL